MRAGAASFSGNIRGVFVLKVMLAEADRSGMSVFKGRMVGVLVLMVNRAVPMPMAFAFNVAVGVIEKAELPVPRMTASSAGVFVVILRVTDPARTPIRCPTGVLVLIVKLALAVRSGELSLVGSRAELFAVMAHEEVAVRSGELASVGNRAELLAVTAKLALAVRSGEASFVGKRAELVAVIAQEAVPVMGLPISPFAVAVKVILAA